MDRKPCVRCRENKSADEFYFNRTLGTLSNVCKPCRRKYEAKRRAADPERTRAKNQEWRERNREHLRAYHKRKREELRDEVLAAYGNACACCGEQERDFLTLDHIDGGGTAHRRAIHGKVYDQVKREGFPDSYRVLCWNCNWAYRLSGSCPHQQAEQRHLRVA